MDDMDAGQLHAVLLAVERLAYLLPDDKREQFRERLRGEAARVRAKEQTARFLAGFDSVAERLAD